MSRSAATVSPPAPSKPHATRPPGPGRPKDLAKRDAILDVAKRMFPKYGFDGVSMDQIAAEAGVSKLTVYSHFGDKESLFFAAVRSKCEAQLPPELFLDTKHGPLRAQLIDIAQAFFLLVSSEDALALHRMMLTPGGDRHLQALFWQAGPQQVQEAFSDFLRVRVQAGELDVPDLARAASQFFCLLKGELHVRLLFGLCDPPKRAEINTHITATVDLFLRAYAPR